LTKWWEDIRDWKIRKLKDWKIGRLENYKIIGLAEEKIAYYLNLHHFSIGFGNNFLKKKRTMKDF
jgi:hypothetical protein